MPNAQPGRPQAVSAGTQSRPASDDGGQSQVNEIVGRVSDSALVTIREHPTAATLVAFGVGLGLGAALGASMATPPRHSRMEVANRLGRRLLDSIQDALPESITPNWS